MFRVVFEIKAFINSQVVYKEFADSKSALEFLKQVLADKNMELIRIEDV